MKKIIKKSIREEFEIYSDFSGELLPYSVPVNVKLQFGYGSEFDMADLELHLSDEDSKELLELIKSKLHDKTKTIIKENLKSLLDENDDAIDSRDWTASDITFNHISFQKFLLGD